MCAVDQKRSFFPRVGPFLELTGDTFNYRKAYGKAGPLREAPYEEGRSLREGPVGLREGRALTGSPLRGGTGLREGRPLREAPHGEERSLREGPGSFTGLGPFTEKNDL